MTLVYRARILVVGFPSGHLVKASCWTGMPSTPVTVASVRVRAGKGAELNLVDLVLTVCVLANPANCRTEHLYFESRGSLVQCMTLAPAEIAKWSEGHPAVKVVRWKCLLPDKGREI